jgi:hypothetical protein
MIWVRVGDAGEYESFDDLAHAVDYLNELGVGRVENWVDGGRGVGIETPNYHGLDFVSLFHGDADANLTSNLLPDERVVVEDSLQECYA